MKNFIQLSIASTLFYFAELKPAAAFFALIAIACFWQSVGEWWANPATISNKLVNFGNLFKRKRNER